jgi:carbon-monoxide dehydrogenase small subunit
MPTAMLKRTTISFSVNGRRRSVETHAMKRLLDVLREECGLTGTKEGCGEGECGACTVLMDGQPVNSCLIPAVQAEGRKLVTVEGLARGSKLSALQQAFVDMGGAQCGICTPGMLLSAHELITRQPGRVPGDQEVREALAGNLCRCTGYQKIVDAVRAAARATKAPAKKTAARLSRSAEKAAPKRKGAKAATKRKAARAVPKRKTAKTAAKRKSAKSAPKRKTANRKGTARRHR